MFKIKLDRAADVAQELERQAQTLYREAEAARQVGRSLSSMSGMGDIVSSINQVANNLEQRQEKLSRMAKCLDKSVLMLDNCENRICRNAEQEIVSYRSYSVGTNDLGELAQMLKGYLR